MTTTHDVLTDLLNRIASGDPDRIAELYAEDCDWQINWPPDQHNRPETPWIRAKHTRAETAGHYREIAAHHIPEEADTQVERILVDGPDAVVFGEIRQTARSTGQPYRARFALHVTVRDGLIVRNHVYEDSLAVARAFENTAAPEMSARTGARK